MDEVKSAYDSLKPQHRLFVDYYIDPGSGNFNQTKAAKLAGYSERSARTQGSRMLKNVDIVTAIKEKLDEFSMSAEEALYRLTDFARSSLKPFLEKDFEENMKLNLGSDMALEKLHFIKEIEQTEKVLISEGEKLETKVVKTKVKIHDASTALVQVAKIRGLFVDRVEHSGAIDTGVRVVDFTDGAAAGEGD